MFENSDLGFWVWDLENGVLGLAFWILEFCFGLLAWDLEFGTFGFRILWFGNSGLAFYLGIWISDIENFNFGV